MNPLEFLAAVLPPTGLYCAVSIDDKTKTLKEQKFASTLPELLQLTDRFNSEERGAFFAVANYNNAKSRTADNTASMRSFFLDMDVGEKTKKTDRPKYKKQADAVGALAKFLSATGLPDPWIVSSGGGVHVYWPFTEAVSIPEWKIAAGNLVRLCHQHEMLVDYGVTADAARVLRMPGTANWKKDTAVMAKVRVVGAPAQHDFAALCETILSTLKEPVTVGVSRETLNVPGTRLAAPKTPSLTNAFSNRVAHFKVIMDHTVRGGGCGQLGFYLNNADDDGMEPLWRGWLSIASLCEDRDTGTKFLTKLHPYTTARMQSKLRDIKGPYPCTKFDTENPGICTTCPHWGKITNPLALCSSTATDTTEKEVTLAAVNSTPALVVTRPTPPRGYAYGTKGGIYRKVTSLDAEGIEQTANKQLLPYDLFAVDILNAGEEGHLVQMVATRPEGQVVVLLPQRSVVSKDDTVKFLAQQNIIASYGAGNDQHLFNYVRGCVEEVSSQRRAVIVPDSYGWQKDNTFVLNSCVYSPTGEKFVPTPKLVNLNGITTPDGSIENWKRVVQLLINKEHHDVLAMACIAFGSPLMKFSIHKALTFHIGSSDSGTGKSLALNLVASVWGASNYIMSTGSSGVMQKHRAGTLRNLPLVIDEVTNLNNKDSFEWLGEFLLDMTAGAGKDRMKASANEERVNITHWQSLMLLASNTHVTDYFAGVRNKASDGQLMRLLELKMTQKLQWTASELQILTMLPSNYGWAGRVYVQWLVRNVDTARGVYQRVLEDLTKRWKLSSDKRFWLAGVSACVAGAILVGTKYANIIDLPVQGIIDAFKVILDQAQTAVAASARDAEDILNSYTREFYGQFVVVRINDSTKTLESSFGSNAVIDQTITRSQVRGRVEHDVVPGHVNYFIEENQMKAWCSHMSYGYSDFQRQLEKKFVVIYCKKDLLSKTKGPPMRVQAIKITRPETTAAIETAENAQQKIPVE